MQPLEITFRLSAPLVIDMEYPIHLDALVAYGVMKDAETMGHDNPWETANDLADALAAEGEGDRRVWKASMLRFIPDIGRQPYLMNNMIRKTEPERFYQDHHAGLWDKTRPIKEDKLPQLKIDTRSGQQRAYQWLSASRWMKEVKAWAYGDQEALEYFLGYLTHLGKMGRNGYGRIRDFAVKPSDDPDAWKLRWLPEETEGKPGVRYEPVSACLRPPYWRRGDRERVLEPLV